MTERFRVRESEIAATMLGFEKGCAKFDRPVNLEYLIA